VLALAAAFAEESRARDRAEEQAALCSALLMHAPDGVAHLDLLGTILFVNRVMGESQPEMRVGCDWLSVQPLDSRKFARQAFEIVVSTGEPSSFETTTIAAADGGEGSTATPRWYSHRLGPIRREGQIIGVMLVARDISHKKLAEAQLLVSDRMASVGMLAASVAHEINNPLAAMMINLELMERDLGHRTVDGERLKRELEGAREGGRRVTQVVRDLKIFSRSSETVSRVKPRDVLECSLRMANNEIRHRAKLTLEFSDVPTVDADESRLGQVFLNLILNAAQSMPEGNAERNELRIAVGTDDKGRVLVTIRDTGCGIPLEDQAQLFRPFFTTKPLGVGTGLGLSICQRIVESLGGAIGFDSRVAEGSTFWVALPPSKRASVPSARPTEAPISSRRGKILIVEDDRLVGDMIKRFLSGEHDVRMVTQANEALNLISCEPCFDVILCDLMMPQMTGQELFAAISKLDSSQAKRMVFMTGGPFTKNAREFLGSVSNHRIDKPFDLHGLRRLMNELVAN
jgi:PAS domain S-box-containing protein